MPEQKYPQNILFDFGEDKIQIKIVSPGNASLESNLCEFTDGANPDHDEWSDYNRAVDGMESLILSMAGVGVDLTTPEIRNAIEDCINQLARLIP